MVPVRSRMATPVVKALKHAIQCDCCVLVYVRVLPPLYVCLYVC